MRCDLHVHTHWSGKCTVTDHDALDAAEAQVPGFLLSEEVAYTTPPGGDVWNIGTGMLRIKQWMGPLAAPLALAVPFVTLGSCVRDLLFAQSWSRRLLDGFSTYPLEPRKEEV